MKSVKEGSEEGELSSANGFEQEKKGLLKKKDTKRC